MHISIKKLEEHGFHVEIDEKVGRIDIYPERGTNVTFNKVREALEETGLSVRDCEIEADRLVSRVNDLRILELCE